MDGLLIPRTGGSRLFLFQSHQSKPPNGARTGEQPRDQRGHVAPTVTRLPEPQAGASAELSQRSRLPSQEVECQPLQLFRKPFHSTRCICGSSCRPQLAQLLRGRLAPPGGERGIPGLPTPIAGSCKRRGGCDAEVRQLPTAGAAASLRTGTGEYAAQVLPLPSDVSAAGYKNLTRSLRRFS